MTDAPEYMHFQPCPVDGWEDPNRSNSSGVKYIHEDEVKELEAERDKLIELIKRLPFGKDDLERMTDKAPEGRQRND